jgi:hypothetical protein
MFRVTTNTIGFSTAGSEAMRIDSSGNLLVGTVDTNVANNSGSGNDGVNIHPDSIRIARTDGDMLLLNRLNSDGDIAKFLKDGTTVGSIGSSNAGERLYMVNDSTGLSFIGDFSNIFPCDSSGAPRDNAINLGGVGGRFKDLHLSGGVVFDAVSGNATSNTLDDYEEGAWTPSMSGMGAATFSQQFGRYTKIGDLVHVTGKIEWTGANGTAQVNITGLPFTATNASDAQLRNSAWPQGDYRNINTLIQRNGHFRVDGVTLFGVVDNTNGYTAGMNCTTHVSSFGEFNFYLVYKST